MPVYTVLYNSRQTGPVTIQNGGVPTIYQQMQPYTDIPAGDLAALLAVKGVSSIDVTVAGVPTTLTVPQIKAIVAFTG